MGWVESVEGRQRGGCGRLAKARRFHPRLTFVTATRLKQI